MSIWFTSDQHFYHTNVIKYCGRPFKDVDEMNAELVRRHNALVSSGDTVIHLGDFALAHRAVTVFLPQLNGEHHLIAGNHDHCHPAHAKKPEKLARMRQLYFDAGFKTITLEGEIELTPKIYARLHHLPYLNAGDHTGKGERFAQFRLKDEGSWLLHGHIHEKWRKRGRMINVGVDVWNYAPVSLQEIVDLIAKGPDHDE